MVILRCYLRIDSHKPSHDCPLIWHARTRYTQIVDKATTRDPYSKALGLHARTLEHYMGMGVLPAVLQEAVAWTTITARSALLRASFGLGSIQCTYYVGITTAASSNASLPKAAAAGQPNRMHQPSHPTASTTQRASRPSIRSASGGSKRSWRPTWSCTGGKSSAGSSSWGWSKVSKMALHQRGTRACASGCGMQAQARRAGWNASIWSGRMGHTRRCARASGSRSRGRPTPRNSACWTDAVSTKERAVVV